MRIYLLLSTLVFVAVACAPPSAPTDAAATDTAATSGSKSPVAVRPLEVDTDITPPTQANPEAGAELSPEALPRAPLDLSMPENLEFAEPVVAEPNYVPDNEFDASALFNDEAEPDTVSATVIPNFKDSEPGDAEFALPEIDGASISIEVKTE